MKTHVLISVKEINVLRETFKKAEDIINRLGMAGSEKPPKAAPRKTKAELVAEFQKITKSGTRVKKPDHLKK